MTKDWRFLDQAPDGFKKKFPTIHPLILQLLYNRGVQTKDEIELFLHPDYEHDQEDPLKLHDMKKVVERIIFAIQSKQKILIYGDYDADGVCATALLSQFFQTFGLTPKVYIPYRDTEGYGLNMNAVREIAKDDIDLIITVDCGIVNFDEVALLKESGIDVIITDHHNPQNTLPQAFAVVNPKLKDSKYTNYDLSGTGVAFKVIQAILSSEMQKKYSHIIPFPPLGFEKWLLDLVAISLVTDLCTLKGENRVLVKYGLLVLQKTKRLGLKALYKKAGIRIKNLDVYSIGFQIGPRLNAAGRLDHASTSYQLLITEDQYEAQNLAQDLDDKNRERQNLTETMFRQAREQVGKEPQDMIVFAKDGSWQSGLVGLIAGKLTDKFFRPAIAIGRNQEGLFVGSGRSIAEFDITSALNECKEFLLHFGGHSQACGFTLKDEASFFGFKNKMNSLVKQVFSKKLPKKVLVVDNEINLEDVSLDFAEELKKLEPYGVGNNRPLFLIKNLKVSHIMPVGKNGNHLKITVQANAEKIVKVIAFNCNEKERWGGVNWCELLKVGDIIDIVFEVDINEWNGNRELELKIVDMKLKE